MKPIPPQAPTSRAAHGSYLSQPVMKIAVHLKSELQKYLYFFTSTQSHHASQSPVESHQEAPWLREEDLVNEEDSQASSGGAQDGVHDDHGYNAAVTRPGDTSLGAAVESQKAKDEDEAS